MALVLCLWLALLGVTICAVVRRARKRQASGQGSGQASQAVVIAAGELDEGDGKQFGRRKGAGKRRVSSVASLAAVLLSDTGNQRIRMLVKLHHWVLMLCFMLFAVTAKVCFKPLYCDASDPLAACDDPRKRPPEVIAGLWAIVVLHCFLFPLLTMLAAYWTHRNLMGGTCCADTMDTIDCQAKEKRTALVISIWRYFVHSDVQARYFWVKTCNLMLLLALHWSDAWMQPAAAAPAKDASSGKQPQAVVSTDVALRTAAIQAFFVSAYLLILIVLRPYVRTRIRFWKLYVSIFNKFTALLVVAARVVAVLAEEMQQRPENRNAAQALDIELAAVYMMAASAACCILQFIVLAVVFVWSLLDGARKEQKVLVEKRARLIGLASDGDFRATMATTSMATGGGARLGRNRQGSDRIVSLDNPLRAALSKRAASRASASAASAAAATTAAAATAPCQIRELSMRRLQMYKKDPAAARKKPAKRGGRPILLVDSEMEAQASEGAPNDAAAAAAAATMAATVVTEETKAAVPSSSTLPPPRLKHAVTSIVDSSHTRYDSARLDDMVDDDDDDEDGEPQCGADTMPPPVEFEIVGSAVNHHQHDGQAEQPEATDGIDRSGRSFSEHFDEQSQQWFRYDLTTGASEWMMAHADDGALDVPGGGPAAPIPEGSEMRAEDKGATDGTAAGFNDGDLIGNEAAPALDDLAVARARLRRVFSSNGADLAADAGLSAIEELISDARGDWVEVHDGDGSVLGKACAGRTVYFNRNTYETRFERPPGWVRNISQNIEARTKGGGQRAGSVEVF